MKIYLKQNWSEQFIYGDETPGIFVGREQEIKSLKSIIKNNDSSAILVSSVRGVGKTSFVHKVLSEIGEKDITPFLINIGHTLAIEDIEKDKQKILVSIIRHSYWENPQDKEIKSLYFDCIGRSVEKHENSNEKETTEEKTTIINIKPNTETLVALFGAFFVGVALVNSWSDWVNLTIGLIGFSGFVFSSKWQSIVKKLDKSTLENTIDDSTDYIEIKFEKWLKNKTKKDKKKLVFVVDELDKIEVNKAFRYIKEYKNLFTRSHAHFIFISSQEAFELTQNNRESSIEDGGIFPTFFTHIFYLSLPKADEIKLYLNKIFITQENSNKEEKTELINYLLFRSGNDFFDLKRLIADVISFDENEEPFIDTDKIKNGDLRFSSIAELFGYVEKWFLRKYLYELKKHWKDNSTLQKEIFKFLNENYNIRFYENNIKNNINLKNLSNFLIDIGIVEKKSITIENNPEKKSFEYIWTNKYKRGVKAPLTEDDKMFQGTFNELIKLANDLDDLPEVYNTNKFKNYTTISKGRDGQNISGIDLYSTYEIYESAFNKLKKATQRINITTEKIKEAKKTIDEQIKSVYQKYFDIFVKTLNKIFENQNEIFKGEKISSANYNIPAIFSTFPDFTSVLSAYEHQIYGKVDQTKYVLIIRYFEDENHINNALEVLRGNKNILVVNLMQGENFKINNPVVYKDSAGRKRKKAMLVDNFINFEFNDFRQFAEILIRIKKHLTI